MVEGRQRGRTFKLIGGRLCLDFVNTVGNWRDPARRDDHLGGYADLLDWAWQAGALTPTEAAILRQEATRRPDAATRALARATELRATLRGVVLARAHGRPVTAADLARLNAFVAESLAASRLAPSADGFRLVPAADPTALDRVLWPIVRSAVDLLTSADLPRVRECADDACGWVFVDASRGGRRRWCDMTDCGNLAKVRRHRARRAATVGTAGPPS